MIQNGEINDWILLASADDTYLDYWKGRINNLVPHIEEFPRLLSIVNARWDKRSTLESAKDQLSTAAQPPILMIVDAKLRAMSEHYDAGCAAIELLKWLTFRASAPALITTIKPPDPVLCYALQHPEVFIWTAEVGEPCSPVELATVLSSLATGVSNRRLILEVGEQCMKYRLQVGSCTFASDEMPYQKRNRIIDEIARFKRLQEKKADGNEELLYNLRDIGKRAFDLMVFDSLGAPISDLILRACDDEYWSRADRASRLDLRLEFDVSNLLGSEFFCLPLELGSHHCSIDSVLCTSIPMARRVRMPIKRSTAANTSAAQKRFGPLRVLFLGVDASGVVSIQPEDGSRRLPSSDVQPLQSVNLERANLNSLELSRRLEVVDVPPLAGMALLDEVRKMLLESHYDILHFSGHSISIGEDSTFLIIPGCKAGKSEQLSIRQVGQWMKDGNCKLLVLSSCTGASVRTAVEVMRAGAEGVLAFRWEVEEKSCARFIDYFYHAYVEVFDNEGVPEAYRRACASARAEIGGTPTWASAVAVVND